MKRKYTVLQFFRWGNLMLEKGQVLEVEAKENTTSIVTVEHYPEKTQLVSTKSVESMVLLQKIS